MSRSPIPSTPHTFHIPVMGLGYTIDTPVKVAHFGISSVVSIIEDELVERMREFHCRMEGEQFVPIPKTELDHRALRITAYLDLLHRIVQRNIERLRTAPYEPGSDITKYFEMLPDGNLVKVMYEEMVGMEDGPKKLNYQEELRRTIQAGAIDVNIMAKIDRPRFTKEGEPLPAEYADAMAAFRGFANSTLTGAVVLSAGYNPRLYAYIAQFPDLLPDAQGRLKKKVILKVSDLRSAKVQGKILAKKGVWVSEYRIESGLNCGGHAFATDGILLGPILEEFKKEREAMAVEVAELCNKALTESGHSAFPVPPGIRITVQGGIGTVQEDRFLRTFYEMDGTGWGSPFLLVPEATNVDDKTLQQLTEAKPDDYYMSWASPLGIPFHNFRPSTSEAQRRARIAKNRPGSPCYKEFLSTDVEFTATPICTASRQYQDLKIKQLNGMGLGGAAYARALERITAKDCLCEGLGASALIKDGMTPAHKLEAVAICPGPNLAYFSRVVSLNTMVDHIYGRLSLLNDNLRSHMFVNELILYVKYLQREIEQVREEITEKQLKYFNQFRTNLLSGIAYYHELIPSLRRHGIPGLDAFKADLERHALELRDLLLPELRPV
ncbi:MAG: hypothetical protein IPI81_03255 [Flavobacteriales bacterium]|nr:hypothetical protein [Flavobacteriales bacterium]